MPAGMTKPDAMTTPVFPIVQRSTTGTLNLSDLALLAGRVRCAPRERSMFKKLAATSLVLALSVSAVAVSVANADPMMRDQMMMKRHRMMMMERRHHMMMMQKRRMMMHRSM